MAELFRDVLLFFFDLIELILRALILSPSAVRQVASSTVGRPEIAILIVGGVSYFLGQSTVLFVNRVSPRRFLLSLLLSGIIFALNVIIWATSIWAIGNILFSTTVPLEYTFQLVALGYAPYLFGLFGLIPYLGSAILRLISIWSFVIVLFAVRSSFDVTLTSAFICVGVGWLVITLLTRTIGRPIIAARHWLLRVVRGTTLEKTATDLLTDFKPRAHREHD